MKRHKIHNARKFVFCFVACLGICLLSKESSSELVAMLAIPGVIFLGCAIWASHCPHCNAYLTFKRNWVGKYCKYCGEKIEKPGDVETAATDGILGGLQESAQVAQLAARISMTKFEKPGDAETAAADGVLGGLQESEQASQLAARIGMTKLSPESAVRLAWAHLCASKQSKKLRNKPVVVRIVTSQEWTSLGINRGIGWVISFPLKLPGGVDMDDSLVGVFVDDATGECDAR
jgi:hypothetical protein